MKQKSASKLCKSFPLAPQVDRESLHIAVLDRYLDMNGLASNITIGLPFDYVHLSSRTLIKIISPDTITSLDEYVAMSHLTKVLFILDEEQFFLAGVEVPACLRFSEDSSILQLIRIYRLKLNYLQYPDFQRDSWMPMQSTEYRLGYQAGISKATAIHKNCLAALTREEGD